MLADENAVTRLRVCDAQIVGRVSALSQAFAGVWRECRDIEPGRRIVNLAPQFDRFSEKAHRFGLRLGHVDTDVTQEIGRVRDISAQLLAEASAAPPRCRQQEDRTAPQNCGVQPKYDRGHVRFPFQRVAWPGSIPKPG